MATNSILLDELEGRQIERLEVLSFEPDIYLANVIIKGEVLRVYAEPGQLLKAFSQLGLKKHFKAFDIAQTHLIHQSAYDEMIGNPAPAGGKLEVSIANPQADLS